MNAVHKSLQNTFLFSDLKEEEIETVASFCRSRTLASGEHLFSEGEPAEAFFVILRGSLKIYKLSPKGEEQILHIQKQNHLVAEAAIFDRRTYPAHAQAIEKCEMIRIETEPFRKTILKQPNLAFKLLSAYSKRLRHFVSMIEDLTLRNTKERLIRYLIENSDTENTPIVCRLNIPKKDLAALLGTIPETLSRVLRELKQSDLISEKGKTIEIVNWTELQSQIR